MSEKLLYRVNPRIPIKKAQFGVEILKEKRIKLDMNQVITCLKHGSVHRLFQDNENRITNVEKVNLSNLARLHQKEFVSETENKEYVDLSVRTEFDVNAEADKVTEDAFYVSPEHSAFEDVVNEEPPVVVPPTVEEITEEVVVEEDKTTTEESESVSSADALSELSEETESTNSNGKHDKKKK